MLSHRSTAIDREVHEQLHGALGAIAHRVGEMRTETAPEVLCELVHAFRKFHIGYLAHMEREERGVELVLVANQTDEDMTADQSVIMQTVAFETLLLWFKYIVLARPTSANRQVLAGLKSAAPGEAFDAVCALLADLLPADRYAAIIDDL